MLKLENIESTWKEETENPFGKFELKPIFTPLIEKLIAIEEELKKINPDYWIEFSPSKALTKENHLVIKLFLNKQEIACKSTALSFKLYHGETEYIPGEVLDIYAHQNSQKEVSFYKKPQIYIELVESFLIKEFIKNEKDLARELAIKDLNKKLRVIQPELEEPKPTLRSHL